MINDVGKTIATLRMSDFTLTLFNSTIRFPNKVNFYDEDGETIRYSLTVDEKGKGSRALQYTRSLPGDSMDSEKRPVIFVPEIVDDSGDGATCIPLYECISPMVAKHGESTYQLTWWTNTSEVFQLNEDGMYEYNYSKVKRFYTESLGDIEDTTNCSKLLCSAPIHWELLKQESVDAMHYLTPVIRDIAILACISGEGYIVDFSTGGGSGGGNKIHSHLNTQDCGFAGAVFMPSATPRVMSWK